MTRSRTVRKLLVPASIALACFGLTPTASSATAPPTTEPTHGHESSGDLTAEQQVEIFRATARFHDVDAAIAAGYVESPIEECVEVDGYGGMGLHYANLALATDGVIDPAVPEVLIYAPTADGGVELVAVEYAQIDADQDLATADDRPELFGHPFDGPMDESSPAHSLSARPVPVHYDLHVWLYRENPDGMLAAFNPDVTCTV
jgi:hypothetical protein